MCNWCDQHDGEPDHCQNCGTAICFDMGNVFATSYGDVYCTDCGRHEQAEIDDMEAEEAKEWGWMDYNYEWYDPDMDFGNEDATGVYIGSDDE